MRVQKAGKRKRLIVFPLDRNESDFIAKDLLHGDDEHKKNVKGKGSYLHSTVIYLGNGKWSMFYKTNNITSWVIRSVSHWSSYLKNMRLVQTWRHAASRTFHLHCDLNPWVKYPLHVCCRIGHMGLALIFLLTNWHSMSDVVSTKMAAFIFPRLLPGTLFRFGWPRSPGQLFLFEFCLTAKPIFYASILACITNGAMHLMSTLFPHALSWRVLNMS